MSNNVKIYLDDLIIANPNVASHFPKLDKVLQHIQDVGLKNQIFQLRPRL